MDHVLWNSKILQNCFRIFSKHSDHIKTGSIARQWLRTPESQPPWSGGGQAVFTTALLQEGQPTQGHPQGSLPMISQPQSAGVFRIKSSTA